VFCFAKIKYRYLPSHQLETNSRVRWGHCDALYIKIYKLLKCIQIVEVLTSTISLLYSCTQHTYSYVGILHQTSFNFSSIKTIDYRETFQLQNFTQRYCICVPYVMIRNPGLLCLTFRIWTL
jgi:hypothetical protein